MTEGKKINTADASRDSMGAKSVINVGKHSGGLKRPWDDALNGESPAMYIMDEIYYVDDKPVSKAAYEELQKKYRR